MNDFYLNLKESIIIMDKIEKFHNKIISVLSAINFLSLKLVLLRP